MKIHCSEHESVIVARLEGELDAENVAVLSEFFETGPGSDYVQFVFDLSGLEYIDSSGLGAFVKRMKEARKKGGDVKFVAPSEDVRKVLELTRLDRVFDIRESSEEARENFCTVS